MTSVEVLTVRLRFMARHERKDGSARDADTLEEAAAEIERLTAAQGVGSGVSKLEEVLKTLADAAEEVVAYDGQYPGPSYTDVLLALSAAEKQARVALGSTEPAHVGVNVRDPQRVSMPNPTADELADPRFDAVWRAIKSWDIGVRASYIGYCGATGSHVVTILRALDAKTSSDPISCPCESR